jgi:hypothetical protein
MRISLSTKRFLIGVLFIRWSFDHEKDTLNSADLHFPLTPGEFVSYSSTKAIEQVKRSCMHRQYSILSNDVCRFQYRLNILEPTVIH